LPEILRNFKILKIGHSIFNSAEASGVYVHFALKQNEPKVQEKTKLPRSLCGLCTVWTAHRSADAEPKPIQGRLLFVLATNSHHSPPRCFFRLTLFNVSI
jgi:hypothetical protein